MYSESIVREIEGALGKRHPNPEALLYERVTFLVTEIRYLRYCDCGEERTLGYCRGNCDRDE